MAFYDAGHEGSGGFNAGIEQMVTAVLVSPDFLYRGIAPPQDRKDAKFHALSDLELASRLSFFLWKRAPDDELLKLAKKGELRRPGVLDAQVRRMLAAPQAETLVTDFALRWLDLLEVDKFEWDKQIFPEFSAELRQDFATEIDLFLRSILLEDKNVEELLTADYTFLNERLARHYGITTVRGAQFRRVHLRGRESLWPPRQGRRAVAHVLWQQDFAGGARRLGSRQTPRHAAERRRRRMWRRI